LNFNYVAPERGTLLSKAIRVLRGRTNASGSDY